MQHPIQLHTLLSIARQLVKRYASQHAWDQAMDPDLENTSQPEMKFMRGTSWVPPASSLRPTADATPTEAEAEGGDSESTPDGESSSVSDGEERVRRLPNNSVETGDFKGDRVLANEILFLQDMGWWVIAHHAVPEGEVGHLWEIMKVNCFNENTTPR